MSPIRQIELPEDVKQIIKTITEAGYEAYAVGGCIRDSVLGRIPEDYDITTLKEIAKRYTPDSRGYVYKWMDVERIISYIVERSDSLSKKGSVFISD